MKRIFAVFSRDFLVSTRDFMLLYIIVAPLLLTMGLSAFIPDVNEAAVVYAVDPSVPASVITGLEQSGTVEVFSSRQLLEERVNASDDVIGLAMQSDSYEIILEGNEIEGSDRLMRMLLSDIENGREQWFPYVISNVNFVLSPIASIGAASLIIMAFIMGGMIMGLNIVEDKELATMRALSSSPLSKFQYIAGKSILAMGIPIVQAPLILIILDLGHVDIMMVMVIAIASLLATILYGMLIGAMTNNQLAAIASAKGSLFIVSASILGAILLKPSLQWTFYWSPIYWMYRGLYEIIVSTATWHTIWLYAGVILALTLVLLAALRRPITNGLNK